MVSMAVTFSLLECNMLSRLRSVPLFCDDKSPEEREVTEEGKVVLVLLSMATMAEVPYPGGFEGVEMWVLSDTCGFLSRSKGEACLLCIPPSSSFIIYANNNI